VIEAGWNGGLGNCIVIDHGYGYRSAYGHLSNMKVTVGQNVKRGDLIGHTGSTEHRQVRTFITRSTFMASIKILSTSS